MFGPDWDAACPGCTAGINETSDGMLAHLKTRDTNFVLVSRAPLEKLQQYQAKMGWTIPWYSSYGSDFNYDFQATADKERQQFVYNYQEQPDLLEDEDSTELPGVQLLPARRRPGLPHVLDLGPGHRHRRQRLLVPRPDGARAVRRSGRSPRAARRRPHGADPTFSD